MSLSPSLATASPRQALRAIISLSSRRGQGFLMPEDLRKDVKRAVGCRLIWLATRSPHSTHASGRSGGRFPLALASGSLLHATSLAWRQRPASMPAFRRGDAASGHQLLSPRRFFQHGEAPEVGVSEVFHAADMASWPSPISLTSHRLHTSSRVVPPRVISALCACRRITGSRRQRQRRFPGTARAVLANGRATTTGAEIR